MTKECPQTSVLRDELISRAAALRQCYSYAAAYAAERIRALPAVAASQMPDPAVKADSQQSVRVKPLVWEGDGYWCVGDNEGWLEEVNTPFGWGYAIEFSSSKQGSWVASSAFGKTLTGFDSPDAAKAAAQADYEVRILAAIEPQPDPQCCMCGKKGLSTVEDGGKECELSDGRWVCCRNCYCKACGDDSRDAVIAGLMEALDEIAGRHIPDQPAAYGGDEADWCRRQHAALRSIASKALAAAKGLKNE